MVLLDAPYPERKNIDWDITKISKVKPKKFVLYNFSVQYFNSLYNSVLEKMHVYSFLFILV